MDERKESTMHGGIDTDPVTLTRFILAEQHKHPEASGDLTIMMSSIQLACKTIATAVRKAGIAGLYGLQGSVNVQGEDVKKLDIVANENFINALKVCRRCVRGMWAPAAAANPLLAFVGRLLPSSRARSA